MGWIVFAAVVIPLLGVLLWMLLDDSIVRIEPGQLGLLIVKGRPTDKSVEPGVHWVPALRRRTIEIYPSIELSLRAGDMATPPLGELERVVSSARVCLADRTRGLVSSTLRYRLDVAGLRTIHTRFGMDGFWPAVRDISEATIVRTLSTIDVDDLYGERRAALDGRLTDELTEEFAELGVVVTLFSITEVDLGQTSAVMETTARARHELAREQAESAMRVVRAQIDGELAPYVRAGNDVALRYREVDSLRELARASSLVVPVTSRPAPEAAIVEQNAPAAAAADDEAGDEA